MTDSFFDALRRSVEDDDEAEMPRTKISYEGEIECLRAALDQFHTPHKFQVGDIVQMKPQCRGYRKQSDNGLAIVVEILSTPIITGNDSGTPYFRTPNDLVIGERTPDGTFVLFHVDSRRFEPAPECKP